MSSQVIDKENVEIFIKKYVNRVINLKYEGIFPVELIDFQWFGPNLVVNVYLPTPPESWKNNDVLRFWTDLTDVTEYAKMVDHNLNSINFMHQLNK